MEARPRSRSAAARGCSAWNRASSRSSSSLTRGRLGVGMVRQSSPRPGPPRGSVAAGALSPAGCIAGSRGPTGRPILSNVRQANHICGPRRRHRPIASEWPVQSQDEGPHMIRCAVAATSDRISRRMRCFHLTYGPQGAHLIGCLPCVAGPAVALAGLADARAGRHTRARRCTNGRQDTEATTEAEEAEGADDPESHLGRRSAGPRPRDRTRPQAAPVPLLPGACSGVPSAQRGHVPEPASKVGISNCQSPCTG